ncbi:hypothetical protein CTI14_50395, partial [Methylobacterium radiotolerans]
MNRLVDVVKVVDLTEGAHIERELMLVKVRAVGKEREEMKRMADIFRGRIIDVTDKSYTIELTGVQEKDSTLSRMTIVTTGSDEVIEQITKHLNRLVDVVKVVDLTEGAHIERELMLVKVRA